MKKDENSFFLLLILSMAFWAGSWVSGKLLATEINPVILVFWRFISTAAAFLPILILKRKSIFLPGKRAVLFLFLSAMTISLYNFYFFKGLQGSLAGKGGVIVTTINPLFTFIFSSLLFNQRTDKIQKIALVLGLSGGIILMEPWTWQQSALTETHNFFFLLCAFFWGILTIFSQQAQKDMHPILYNTLLYTIGALIISIILPEGWVGMSTEISVAGWLNILYLAVPAGIAGAGLYFYAASRLGASKASTFNFLVPVLALLFCWIILGERAEWSSIAGGALSITAVLLINGKIRTRRFQTSD